MNFLSVVILCFKVLIPLGSIIIIIRTYLKNKTIETKRFKIEKMMDDIKCSMIYSKDNHLNQEISIRLKRVSKRINDFTKSQIIAGEFLSFLLVFMASNRQYNLIDNELEEHLETLTKIKDQLPKSIT